MSLAAMMLVALAIDAAIGWPDRLFRRIGHPVTWMGALIAGLDRRWNRGSPAARRIAGVGCVAAVGLASLVPAAVLQAALPAGWPGMLTGGALAWPLVAARSMGVHVRAVATPLQQGRIDAARHAVGRIVGRDPARLDRAGIARATLESLAENTSDGIVAPVFWGAVAGLPGIALYKAVNTMDSMIGHRTPRHEDFGKAAARLDDLANLIPARLTGLLFAAVSGRPRRALACMLRDARQHRSPNAGWPEAAMAGALDVRLSGPRIYASRVADEPWLNGAAPDPQPETVSQGLALYLRAMVLLAACLLAASLI